MIKINKYEDGTIWYNGEIDYGLIYFGTENMFDE